MSQLFRMRLQDKDMEALVKYSNTLGVSPSAVVREALRQHKGFKTTRASISTEYEHLNDDLTTVSDGPVPSTADGAAGRDVVTWGSYRGEQEPCHD